jgi:quercetin dioxygenase-like cupin family protein
MTSVQSWDLLSIEAPAGTRDPRVVVEDDGARAVLVVLGPGQQLGEHQVRENAWVVVLEGVLRVVEPGGEPLEFGRGTLLRWEPAQRHALGSEEGARLLLILTPWPGKGHYEPSVG